eukprot:CAMPEP_0119435458 /NCGR_PEP_ID=MMETSP1335-20130426/51181_1 /TAXON_ID=259385 /ORGANISM="Chrysoculter rhomboideus, Strain RCC1486" /LENGTH=66 /DNA_ID=CAMNT_0007461319 /DNA_START=501 /DNA_END=701 /DNA_ORIENTATION=+
MPRQHGEEREVHISARFAPDCLWHVCAELLKIVEDAHADLEDIRATDHASKLAREGSTPEGNHYTA